MFFVCHRLRTWLQTWPMEYTISNHGCPYFVGPLAIQNSKLHDTISEVKMRIYTISALGHRPTSYSFSAGGSIILSFLHPI